MKKYFVLFIVFFGIVFCSGKNNEYYLLKKKYLKGDNFSLDNFYNNYKKDEFNQMRTELTKFFKERKDEEAIIYILKNIKMGAIMYYFANFYECEDRDCSSRLLKNYQSLYNFTKDIESYSTILSFKKILGKNKYNELENFFIKNNSLYAINKKKIDNNYIENEFKNPKIKVGKKEYTILQKREVNLNNNKKYIYLLSNLSDENIKSYLYYKGDKDYLIELEIHTVGNPYNIDFFDINNDNRNEIIIENLNELSDFNNLFIFKINENEIKKVFDAQQNIKLKNYFNYNNMLTKLDVKINDDFNLKKHIKYELPNIIETKIIDSDFPEIIFGIIKNKIIFRIKGFQNFEIIFDKNFDYKLKATSKFSVTYGIEDGIIVNNFL